MGVETHMIGHHAWYHLGPGETTTILVALIGFAGIAITNGIRGRQVAKKVEQKVDQVVEQQDTGNEKKLGSYIHDMAQMQELLFAQMHTNTKEILILSKKLDQHSEKLDEHIYRSEEIHEELVQYREDQKDQDDGSG